MNLLNNAQTVYMPMKFFKFYNKRYQFLSDDVIDNIDYKYFQGDRIAELLLTNQCIFNDIRHVISIPSADINKCIVTQYRRFVAKRLGVPFLMLCETYFMESINDGDLWRDIIIKRKLYEPFIGYDDYGFTTLQDVIDYIGRLYMKKLKIMREDIAMKTNLIRIKDWPPNSILTLRIKRNDDHFYSYRVVKVCKKIIKLELYEGDTRYHFKIPYWQHYMNKYYAYKITNDDGQILKYNETQTETYWADL